MAPNRKPPEPHELARYDENRRNFPLDELAKYAGQYVAFSLDGTHILASGAEPEEVEEKLTAQGIAPNRVVHSYIDPPDVVRF
jgi:hypothetical protein